MLDKIKAVGLYVLAFLIGICWLIFSSRRAGKKEQELRQKAKVLSNVEKAKEVERGVDELSPSERRDKLRNGK